MTVLEVPLEIYIVCWGGAIVLYFKLKSDGRPPMEFLPHIKDSWRESPTLKGLDILIFSVVGAFVATIFTQPDNAQQALAAGLGWTGLLSAAPPKGTGAEA